MDHVLNLSHGLMKLTMFILKKITTGTVHKNDDDDTSNNK